MVPQREAQSRDLFVIPRLELHQSALCHKPCRERGLLSTKQDGPCIRDKTVPPQLLKIGASCIMLAQ